MRVLQDLKIDEFAKKQVVFLNSLPERAKEVLFTSFNKLAKKKRIKMLNAIAIGMGDYKVCQSPIEKILCSSLDMVYALRMDESGLLLDFALTRIKR